MSSKAPQKPKAAGTTSLSALPGDAASQSFLRKERPFNALAAVKKSPIMAAEPLSLVVKTKRIMIGTDISLSSFLAAGSNFVERHWGPDAPAVVFEYRPRQPQAAAAAAASGSGPLAPVTAKLNLDRKGEWTLHMVQIVATTPVRCVHGWLGL
jgi:hypothetical protein